MKRLAPGVLVVFTCVAGLVVFSGCKPHRDYEKSTADARSRSPESNLQSWSPVVATIGDREIDFSEITDNLDNLPVFVRMRYKSPERRLEFLEAYIEYQVIALEAVAEGFGRDPVVVDAFKRDLARRYLVENVDMKLRSIDIPEQDMQAWYDDNSLHFSRPAQNHIFRILVKDEKKAAQVSFRMKSLIESVSGSPVEFFARHVAKTTEDPRAYMTKGELGWFPYGGSEPLDLPPEVVAAAEEMTGLFSVSDPVRAEDGWSILFVAAHRPPIVRELDEARAEIAGIILDQRRFRARRELADSLIIPLKEQGKIDINFELLNELAAQDTAARIKSQTENKQ